MADEKISIETALQKLFECRDQIHLWHLQTKCYAEHKALDDFYNGILSLADEITENWQGHSAVRVAGITPLKTAPYKSTAMTSAYLVDFMAWLGTFRAQSPHVEIQNLIDEATTLTAKTVYLLTLD